ncbi:diguanylate cyclase [Myxococcus llanfairpwllgwyngyllgogerychwyrndrobwllllantysiliogogogochensis]|uniref:diguanylate cyclase n=1 Tax=Myxococcus llanfairpwllgwyngyllgogerychwyrndrobwllllantysiliogogogochensis TaxID=2590453 RepID=A0A540WJI4_9BACT|nr:diguanylate cyclase [Myxococcus llanfairpwllgwyngyllgogerychwyrndrobwllllantysiliogogogochensis]TQF09007.1 diguanylate cyclase [Myxococcus llanfairpwllgwyngyllgogerychwyrndrobwllllantysiliogogogochensis]
MPLGPDTVGRKLLWSIALPGLVVALLGVGHFWREARVAVQDATQVESLALAEFVASTFMLPQGPGAPAHGAVAEVLHSDTRLFRSVADVRVLTPDGRVRWSREPSEVGSVHPEASRLTRPGPETARSADDVTEVVRPLGGPECGSCHSRGEVPGASVLQMRMTEPALHQQLTKVFGGALGSMAVFAILLALVIALSLHFNLTRPLRRLSAAMGRAEAGDLLVRADVRGTDEIARLGAAFNQMLARLTAMKAEEIDTHRDLELVKEKLALKDELEDRLRELSLLFDVTRSLNATLELDELLEAVTRLVVERLQIPEFSIMLVSPEGALEVKQAWPEGRSSEGLTFSVGEGACGRAAQTHKAVYLPDVADHSSIFARRGLVTDAMLTGALLAVPMVHAGTLMGVVNFQRPLIASFSAGEIELLTAVADIAAAAVKNAQLHAETVKLTMTDPLTGVPNRRHLFQRMELELARAQRFGTSLALLMVDVDHFKRLNDLAGHRAGDETLRRVCDILRSRVRKVDTLARYGGEEFVILLPQATKQDAVDVAEKLRRAVAETIVLNQPGLPGGHVTVSVGVSHFPSDANTQEGLVDSADAALYCSKRTGRNRTTPFEMGMEIHPGRERGPHAPPTEPTASAPPGGVAKA